MTKEELLQERYEVIGLWPYQCPYKMGDIIYSSENLEGKKFFDTEVHKYPHLFRRLEWWEKRSVEDMPEFIKLNNEILPVHYSHNEDGSLFLRSENVCFSVGNRYYPITPATEQEYNDYITQVKK